MGMKTLPPDTTGYDCVGIGCAHLTFSFRTLFAVSAFSSALLFECAASASSDDQSEWGEGLAAEACTGMRKLRMAQESHRFMAPNDTASPLKAERDKAVSSEQE